MNKILFFVTVFAVTQLQATGQFMCQADDESLKADIFLSLAGAGGGLLSGSKVKIHFKKKNPFKSKALFFQGSQERSVFPHFWMLNDELKFRAYMEPNSKNFSTYSFVVDTKLLVSKERLYRGLYRLEMEEPSSERKHVLSGAIRCAEEL